MASYSLYDAKAQLSALVDRAASGESMITKNGSPRAQLVPIPQCGRRVPANAMRIRQIATDFDEHDPDIERLFNGDAGA
jgi:prevent-host-death family protein